MISIIKEQNTLNMKALGDNTKHIVQHALINYKEPKVPHTQCKTHLTKTGHMTMRYGIKSMKCSSQHRADNIQKIEATHMITINSLNK